MITGKSFKTYISILTVLVLIITTLFACCTAVGASPTEARTAEQPSLGEFPRNLLICMPFEKFDIPSPIRHCIIFSHTNANNLTNNSQIIGIAFCEETPQHGTFGSLEIAYSAQLSDGKK